MMGAWTGDEENDEESGDAGKESTPHPDEALREKTKPATAKTQTAKKSKNHKDQPGKSPTKDDEIAALKKQLASLQTKLDEL